MSPSVYKKPQSRVHRTDGGVDEAQEDDGADRSDVVLGELREPLAQHLVQAVAHDAQLGGKPAGDTGRALV